MNEERFISVIVPNYNGSATIGRCLEAALSSRYNRFEVVVVDDCSTDNSVEIIKRFPCKLVQLDKRSGASKARNTGAKNSAAEFLFFTDADCLLQEHTLAAANKTLNGAEHAVVGGTYTKVACDDTFFSTFQSVFIHYSETKKRGPDYIATHAMLIRADVFHTLGGFPEEFLPILEDVEFSHRLRRAGCRLIMNPDIQVRHIFNFTLLKSLRNAFRKTSYWVMYSLKNKDLLRDSGTASLELKTDVVSFFISMALILITWYTKRIIPLAVVPVLLAVNIVSSRRLFRAFYTAKGYSFALRAALYYLFLYPVPVGAGAAWGILNSLRTNTVKRAHRT